MHDERALVRRRAGDLIQCLSCSLCNGLLVEPVTSPACRHTYCYACIDKHVRLHAANKCPACLDRPQDGVLAVVLGPKPFIDVSTLPEQPGDIGAYQNHQCIEEQFMFMRMVLPARRGRTRTLTLHP